MKSVMYYNHSVQFDIIIFYLISLPPPGGGGTLGISGWGCAAGTLEPLTYTRARSAEFCHPILE